MKNFKNRRPSVLPFFLFALFATCNSQPAQTVVIKNEYLISYKKGFIADTVLNKRSFYDSENTLIKEDIFYNARIVQVYKYLYNEPGESKYLKLKDSIVYVIRNNEIENKFFNGKIINTMYYNQRGDIIREINRPYNLQNALTIEKKFLYAYENGEKKYETFLFNNDTVYKATYTDSKDSAGKEKYFIVNRCCEGNEPIPPDKIIYQYDKDKKLITELAITDKTIKRLYKERYNGYYNKVMVTAYTYDDKNRLTGKKIYTPNFTTQNVSIDSLFNTPGSLSEEYFYRYTTSLE